VLYEHVSTTFRPRRVPQGSDGPGGGAAEAPASAGRAASARGVRYDPSHTHPKASTGVAHRRAMRRRSTRMLWLVALWMACVCFACHTYT
jgi:hypothetical protein